ncbi:MAG: hypothetical protein IKT16_08690, partial [Desulfovibrio sp.]|nr:hypothetical protein [Desulfovibrio sp.]
GERLVRRPFLHPDFHGRHLVVIVHQLPHRLDGDEDQFGVQFGIDGNQTGDRCLRAAQGGGGAEKRKRRVRMAGGGAAMKRLEKPRRRA